MDVPLPDRWDYTSGIVSIALLVLAYGVYPHRVFQYAAWLVIFTIWMAWFVYFGTKWFYGVEA